MTYAEKINKSLYALIHEGYTDHCELYRKLARYARCDDGNGDSFDTQYYFNSFYISMAYYKNSFRSICIYTDRHSSDCPVLALEGTGDIIVGRAIDVLSIYNGCKPSARDMASIGMDIAGYDALKELRFVLTPVMDRIALAFKK